MPPTLASLVRAPALDLRVLAGKGGLEREVRWVHTSELADPTPYLEGGELLLTTGMKLGRSNAERRAYVERLAAAEVAGLGIGVGLTLDRVPAVIVETAESCGFPVFEVPRPTPFIAISKVVSSALAAEQYETVTTGFAVQQELTRAAAGREGAATLIRRLAGRLDGWAALYDADGTLRQVAPAAARPRTEALRADIDKLRRMPAPSSASLQEDEDGGRVVVQSLGAERRISGFLAVGTDRPARTADRQTLGTAASLLTLALEQSRAGADAGARMRTALLRLLLTGERATPAELAHDIAADLPPGPWRMVVATGPDAAVAAFAERLCARAVRAGTPALTGELAGATVLVLPESVDPVEPVDLPGLVAGVSGPVEPDRAGEGYRQALGAHAVGLRSQKTLTVHGRDVGGLLPLLDGDAVHAWADQVLAPLRAHDAGGRGDLIVSLRAWLARHGQWDAAAGDLGVHRHTLRYRIRRVEEILGRTLDDPDTRAELWFALRDTTGTAEDKS
ncbi:PucR family transcriptional regulator [Embleya sp. MST-111070]|uniref:PucR family transcriptional regulator n=1 Tax=Embleya sp. MST-111070 TaxID=3398231 RepID=UPI003F7389C4